MPKWLPSDDLSSFYSGRMAPPIKLPDGTYISAPNTMSVEEMYRDIYPPAPPPVPSTPLVSRSVNTVPIDPYTGNPIGFSAPTMAASRAEQRSGWRPAITQGVQPAGTVTMPPGARPASVDRMMAGIQPSGGSGRGRPTQVAQSPIWDPFGTRVAKHYTTRLPVNNGGEAGFLAAFDPQAPTNPALGAINGALPPLPRVRPIPPARTPIAEITARGGNKPPKVPLPRVRPTTAIAPVEITVRGGEQMPPLPRARPAPVPRVPDHRPMTARGLTPAQSMALARQTNDIWAYGAGGTPDTGAETIQQTIARIGYNPYPVGHPLNPG